MSRPERWVWRQVWWPRPFDPELAVELLDRLAADRHLGELVFEARSVDGQIDYLLANRAGYTRSLTLPLSALVPGVRFAAASASSRPPVTTAGHVGVSHHSLALNGERITAISRAVLAGLAGTDRDEELVLQVLLGGRLAPPNPIVRMNATDDWFSMLIGTTPAATAKVPRQRSPRQSLHGFSTTVRIGARGGDADRDRRLITGVLGGIRVAEVAGVQIDFARERPGKLHGATRPWRWPLRLSVRELAGLLGWPIDAHPDAALPGHPGAHPRQLQAPAWVLPSPRPFAETTAPGEVVRVGIAPRDALQHTVLLGPTASGKSTAMLNQIMAAVDAGRSVLVIDPKTDLVNAVLARLPEQRRDEVVVIDPTSPSPVGINPLRPGQRGAAVTADAMLAIFRDLSGEAWGPRVNEVLSAALATLAQYPSATLVMLPSLLTDAAFRAKVRKRVHDPLGLDLFWDSYEAMSPAQRAQVIAPAMTRLRQFLMRPQLRAVLGQAEPAFDLSDLFTKRRIVLVSLNKGLLGAEAARLLGSLIVGQLWPLILARAALSPEQRHIVQVSIDEVQDYVAAYDNLGDSLSQARGLGVGFTIAHQYRRQLPPGALAAIDANARNKIIFGLNGDDAADLARQATGLGRKDFTLLPRFGVYMNLVQGGHATGWFSGRTLPPPPELNDTIELRARSAALYGRDAHAVERDVLDAIGLPAAPQTEQSDEPIGRRRIEDSQA